MIARPFLLHALLPPPCTPVLVKRPVSSTYRPRYKATGIPFVPGSSIKGVLRDARRAVDQEKTGAVFGPSDEPAAHAGALVVGDARLLALPVRSFRGTFAWTTSPLLLTLARRDLEDAALPIPGIAGRGVQVARGSCCVHQDRLYLEDLDLPATESSEATAWARLAPRSETGAVRHC